MKKANILVRFLRNRRNFKANLKRADEIGAAWRAAWESRIVDESRIIEAARRIGQILGQSPSAKVVLCANDFSAAAALDTLRSGAAMRNFLQDGSSGREWFQQLERMTYQEALELLDTPGYCLEKQWYEYRSQHRWRWIEMLRLAYLKSLTMKFPEKTKWIPEAHIGSRASIFGDFMEVDANRPHFRSISAETIRIMESVISAVRGERPDLQNLVENPAWRTYLAVYAEMRGGHRFFVGDGEALARGLEADIYCARTGDLDENNGRRAVLAAARRDCLAAGGLNFIMSNGVTLVTLKPERECFDAMGRPHRSDGPAVVFRDGTELFFEHGVLVSPDVILNPESLTADQVINEPNAEVRRVLIDKIGMARFLKEANPVVVDEDVDQSGHPRRLLRVATKLDRPTMILHVIDPSKRIHGDAADVFLEVPETLETISSGPLLDSLVPPGFPDTQFWSEVNGRITTCHAAAAWTFHLPPSMYRPMMET